MDSSNKAQYAVHILQESLGRLVEKCGGGNRAFVCVTTAAVSGAVCLYAGWRLRRRYFSGGIEEISAAEVCLELSLSKRRGSGTFSRCESIVSTASGSDIGGAMRDTYRLALVVRSDLGMGPGKMASQCCRAFWGEAKKMQARNYADLYSWEQDGQTIVVYQISGEEAMLQLRKDTRRAGVICHTMVDRTRDNQKTAIAIGPARSEAVYQLTSELKLL